jgi:cholest-4-en-3-one 26-monooxygenase
VPLHPQLPVDLTDLDAFVAGVPHDQFDRIRAEAPVYFHPERDAPGFWCITRHDDLHRVSHEWEVFSSEWGITLHEADEEQLAQQRMMMLMM